MKKNLKKIQGMLHLRSIYLSLKLLLTTALVYRAMAGNKLDNPSMFAPSISLIKTGIAIEDIDAGPGCNFIIYTYTVTNTSTNGEVLETVQLTDPQLDGIIEGPDSGDFGNDGIMEPGEIWQYSAIYTIEDEDIILGEVSSQANVTANVQGQPGVTVEIASDDDGSFLENPDPTIIDLTFCQGDIAVVKTGVATGGVDAGPGCNFVLYTFSVTNQGTRVLQNVVLDDPLLGDDIPGPDSGDLNDDDLLDTNEVWSYSGIYEITPEDIANGFVENQAEVTANVEGKPEVLVSDQSDNDSVFENDSTIVVLTQCQEPEMGLIKEGVVVDVDNDGCLESILYTFTLTNTGNADLDTITLVDPLLDGTVNGPVDGTDVGDDGILSVDETWTYTALYSITQEDIDNAAVINQATVTGFTPDDTLVQDLSDDDSLFEDEPTRTPVPDDACTDGNSSIGLIKTGELADVTGDGCIESIVYTFTITNNGTTDLDTIILEDPLLEDTINGPVNDSDENNDGVLSVGETWTYVGIYAITQTDIDNGTVINQAEVSAEPVGFDVKIYDLSDDDNLLENQPTRTPVPDDACTDGVYSIAIIKQGVLIDINGDGCLESILYTFTVTNNGSIDLDEVNLEDPLFNDDVLGPVNETDINNDGILSAGETWAYEAIYALEQVDIDNGFVINQASVTANGINFEFEVSDFSDDDSFLEDEPTNTPIPNDACTDGGTLDGGSGIGLIKTGELADVTGDGCIESIVYTFTVTNNGVTDLDTIILEDPLLEDAINGPVNDSDENNDGVLSVGETWTYVGIYAITQIDIDNGTVINQAEVSAEPVGFDVKIYDLSDDDNLLENSTTQTNVPENACTDGGIDQDTGLGLIKEAELIDGNGDGCPETIRYTFSVRNNSIGAMENVLLTDLLLDGTIEGLVAESDVNGDGILSSGETWTYEALYGVVQSDIDAGTVSNQATVTASLLGIEYQFEDLSDNDSYTENEATQINIPNTICVNPNPENPIVFEIFNGITPNDDGLNDYFFVRGIENFPQNKLQIFNRWGVLVFEKEGYGQDDDFFIGISNGRATMQKNQELASGTYFYILTFSGDNPGESEYTGYLYINRK